MSLEYPALDRTERLREIAVHLSGNWTIEIGPYRVDYLTGPGHERLECLFTGRNLRVEGVLPKVGRYSQVRHIINVTTSKRPQVIAAEIERRLLPAYRADLAPARDLKAAADSRSARTLALCADLGGVLGPAWIRDTDALGRPRLTTSCHYPFRHQVELRFDHYEETVDIQLRRADPDLARAIARLIADHPGPLRD
jgi:hypothetical protein